MLKLLALMRKRAEELHARPDLTRDQKAEMLERAPDVAALMEELKEEIILHTIEEVMHEDTFFYRGTRGKVMFIADETLLQMSDPELAAWTQGNGVMFAQVKAHLAERYPETRLRVVSG
jgi:hypothetical protein